jgi:hypothetical protein
MPDIVVANRDAASCCVSQAKAHWVRLIASYTNEILPLNQASALAPACAKTHPLAQASEAWSW